MHNRIRLEHFHYKENRVRLEILLDRNQNFTFYLDLIRKYSMP